MNAINHLILKNRTQENVKEFWQHSQDEVLNTLFPFQQQTLEQAIALYEESLKEDAKSFGQSIYIDEVYIGDVWCYCIDEEDEKSCFLSIVIFEKTYWGQGIATQVLKDFTLQIKNNYQLNKICAFSYLQNTASIKTLHKVGFESIEEFVEDDKASIYFELVL